MAQQGPHAYAQRLAFLLFGASAFACGASNHAGTPGASGSGASTSSGSSSVTGSSSSGVASGASTTGAAGAGSATGSTSTGSASTGSVSTGAASTGAASTGSTSDGGGAIPGSPAGSHCTQATDCQSGTCTGGYCLPSVMLPNTTCATGPDCASGVCTAGKCVIPAGASGTVDTMMCPAGSLGCMCQPMNHCAGGLTCTGGMCCNAKTGSCSPGTAPKDAGSEGGATTASACTPGVVGPVITECGYPYASSNALTDILFNESTVLAAIVPSGGYPFASIQLFYDDEHAMTLGVHETVINGVTTMFPVSPLPMSPSIVNMPATGTNLILGQQAGVDPVGRPMWPALFITDITHDVNDVSGDWQWGGAPVNPSYVAGTWKGAIRTVTTTGVTITPDMDPMANMQNYGNGHTPPAGSLPHPSAYGTEVRWDIRLEAGHNYRFQVMVHDGDENKIGGDSGEACVTFCAGNMCPTEDPSCTTTADCTSGSVCAGGCCIAPATGGSDGGTAGGSDGGTAGGSDGGACSPGWQTYVPTGGGPSICTPPPTNGTCPTGYVITIQNGQQYCTPQILIVR